MFLIVLSFSFKRLSLISHAKTEVKLFASRTAGKTNVHVCISPTTTSTRTHTHTQTLVLE